MDGLTLVTSVPCLDTRDSHTIVANEGVQCDETGGRVCPRVRARVRALRVCICVRLHLRVCERQRECAGAHVQAYVCVKERVRVCGVVRRRRQKNAAGNETYQISSFFVPLLQKQLGLAYVTMAYVVSCFCAPLVPEAIPRDGDLEAIEVE